MTFVLHDDGYGRIAVETDGVDGVRVVADELRGWTTAESFPRAVRSLRWSGSTAVVFGDGARWSPAAFRVDVQTGAVDGARVSAVLDRTGSGAGAAVPVTTEVI